MTDGVPKQTGNSRYLKSAIDSDITFEQFRYMLRNGTLPIDLNGINPDGWAELGTPLNKASLLSAEATSILGILDSSVPSDAFKSLKTSLNSLTTIVNSKAEVLSGTYMGNDSSTRTLNIGFRPSLVIIGPRYINGGGMNGVWMLYPNSMAYSGNPYYDGPDSEGELRVKWNANGITMTDTNVIKYYNFFNEKYFYIAFK